MRVHALAGATLLAAGLAGGLALRVAAEDIDRAVYSPALAAMNDAWRTAGNTRVAVFSAELLIAGGAYGEQATTLLASDRTHLISTQFVEDDPRRGSPANTITYLVDQSDGVAWWLRLYPSDGAYITRMPAGRYFPDFIVIDTEGVHWLVETKSDAAAANDLDVAAKKRAAEDWVAAVNESKSFGVWRYLLVTESNISNSPNWSALLHAVGVL